MVVDTDMTPLVFFYSDQAQADEWLADPCVLAFIQFQESVATTSDPRVCALALPELAGTATVEVWRGAWPAQTGILDGVGYADNGAVLFLQLSLNERSPADLSLSTSTAYRRLFAAARARGYPHLLRVWNYFPDITRKAGGLERYQAFCVGRHLAFVAELTEFETRLPAACAIGAQGAGLRIHALAAREAGVQIENPRQVSAFRYPRQYGPTSPSFSRAILKDWGAPNAMHLYISGTASVVGHASQHLELMAQLEETLRNLQALLEQANRMVSLPLRPALLKIYMRPDFDPAPLRDRIVQAFGAVPLLFLHAEICRPDLLVEIEGTATSEVEG